MYRRDWVVPLPDLPASGVYAYAWSSDFAMAPTGGTRAGVQSGGFGILPMGDEPDAYGPGPNAGFGSYFGSGAWDTRTVEAGESLQAVLWYEMTDAGVTTTSDGLGVVAVPLTPPAA